MIAPALYVGTLHHRRRGDVPHQFAMRTFMPLLDVDRLAELMAVSWCTSWNRWNWATFDDRDHLGDARQPLRARLEASARAAGIALDPSHRIFLLTHLRYLGYCFNPVSFYYVCDDAGAVRVVLAEVHNTFGGTHLYWLTPTAEGGLFRARAQKAFYVSPFLPVDLEYAFALTAPGDRLTVRMEASRAGRTIFDATLALERRPWTSGSLLGQLARMPAATLATTAGIHWQALRLWWKGARVVPRLTRNGEGERQAWATHTETGAATH